MTSAGLNREGRSSFNSWESNYYFLVELLKAKKGNSIIEIAEEKVPIHY